jgi:superfamily I DNA and RNA helicase
VAVEREIAVFDAEQKRAALNILDGPQRIRGLAGSGKTIILTMKAAQIHLQHPEAQILYTFYTKSLYDLIKVLITRFYRTFSDNDPDWSKIDIMHAWGGYALPGVYSTTAAVHNLKAMTLGELRQYPDPFNFACGDLILNDLKRTYDFALLDEAQDFPVNFYRLCERITKNTRIIWGYDECQNILNIDLQDAKKTFGKKKDGADIVDFATSPDGQLSDIVLQVCYRNPRRVLIAAFSLGFGLYSDQIVQILENNDHWNDLGFRVVKGNSVPGDKMVIERPEDNSPLVGVRLLEDSESVQIHVLKDLDSECAFISERIVADIASELLPEDILVIALDDRNARTYFDGISALLRKKDIRTFNLLQAPNNTKHFRVKDHVTLSTVYRAKGNEAASVYVLGVDAVFEFRKSVQHRNRLFTAITRAKAWVTLTGIGNDAIACKEELTSALNNYPRLEFKMPDKRKIKVFQRDLEEGQAKRNEIEREITFMAKKLGLDPQELFQQLVKKPKTKK